MSRKLHVHAQGEILLLKSTINDMVDRLDNWSMAVKRVARDVGVDGKMGQQASVTAITGRWKEITVDVNIMAQVCMVLMLRVASSLTLLQESHFSSSSLCRYHQCCKLRRLLSTDHNRRFGRDGRIEAKDQQDGVWTTREY